jgi:hypothetical protein
MMSTLSSVAMTTPVATSTTTRRPPARAVVVRASASSIARLNRRPLNHRGSHRSSTRSRVGLVVRAASSDSGPPGKKKEEKYSNLTKMRSEAQAPFRTFRLFIFGAFAANATLGLSIATLQAVTKALGAPAAPPLEQSLQNIGIDLAAALFFGYLFKRDTANREKQMARISREERLSDLRCELSSGKTVSLFDLRGFSRVVIAAGDAAYCDAAIEQAEQVRDPLVERGVLLIPLVLDGSGNESIAPPNDADRRFRATPVNTTKWTAWIDEQKKEAKVGDGKGVYVGLRMDGRVRSSGVGVPPWQKFAAELPPADKWGGFLDGFDGRVGVDT